MQSIADLCRQSRLAWYLQIRGAGRGSLVTSAPSHRSADAWATYRPTASVSTASEPTEALSPAMIAHLEQELEAMRALVRREVDGRLAAVESGNGPGWGGPWWWRRLWRRLSDWLAALLVGGLLWTGWQLQELRGQQAGNATKADGDERGAGEGSQMMEPDPATPPAKAVAANPPRGDTAPTAHPSAGSSADRTADETADAPPPFPMDLSDPVAQWRAYLSKNRERIPSWAGAIANTTHKMSETQRGNFRRYGADPEKTSRANTVEFLRGAFEVAVRESVSATLDGRVDLSIGKKEYSAQHLREAADKLGVGALLADPLDAKSTKVRVGIAVAYLERLTAAEP